VIAFDLDGTLVEDRSSWKKIHRHFGVEELARNNMQLYESGKIDYEEFMRRDIALWPSELHLNDIELLLSKFALNSQARVVTSEIKKMGYEIVIVSAGLDLLANKVAEALDLTIVLANGLQTDFRGYLTGNGIFRVDLLRKDLALENALRSLGVSMRECMAVGDSKYDTTFLQRAGFGVAVGKDPDLATIASFVINELSELIPCIGSIESKLQASS